MLKLEDIFTPKVNAALIVSRHEASRARAVPFICDVFPHLRSSLNQEQIEGVTALAYSRSRARGQKTEREHWHYLILSVLWGSFFEDDPQYAEIISQSTWTNPYEDRKNYLLFPNLINEAKTKNDLLLKDLIRKDQILAEFARMYTNPPKRLDYDTVSASLRACWPNKFDALNQEYAKDFMDVAARRAQETHGLRGPDLLCVMCLALFFGTRFLDDPLYPWAQSAMKIENAADRRHALGQGVLSYFQSLKESRL